MKDNHAIVKNKQASFCYLKASFCYLIEDTEAQQRPTVQLHLTNLANVLA